MTPRRSPARLLAGVAAAGVAVLAACGSSPRVEAAVKACNTAGSSDLVLGDGGRSVTIDGAPTPGRAGAPMATVQCILKLLEVSDDVMAGIGAATVSDGPRTGDWDGLRATWAVSPVTGMRITITETG